MAKNSLILITIVAMLSVAIKCHDDYYKILGVDKTADEKQIKKAFRKMSAKYHPDRDGSEMAKEMYQKINVASEVLADKQKRHVYNTRGVEGVKEYEKNQGMAEQGYHSQMRTGPNYQVELVLTLEELYKGVVKEYKLQRNIICDSCSGTGAKDGNMKTCQKCNGRGAVIENVRVGMGFTMRMENQCNKCGGTGKQIHEHCPRCKAKKVIPEYKTFMVDVEAGMANKQHITFEGESEQHPDFLPGDIIFVIKERPNDKFRRENNDLHTTMTLTLKEALLGFKKYISHLDGHVVIVSSEKPIQPFEVMTIEGEGMPLHNTPMDKGNLYVKILVKFPRSTSSNERKLLEKIYTV